MAQNHPHSHAMIQKNNEAVVVAANFHMDSAVFRDGGIARGMDSAQGFVG
jgi:hypothetical protein